MKKTVGLWIDHKKALIVFLAGNDAETTLVSSNIEKQHRQSGVSTPADDIRQRKSTGKLSDFYDDVISCIRGAEEILILGPGEAKGELRKRLEKNYLGRRIVGVETSQRMTHLQTVAKVREYFLSRVAAASSK
jgi:stalled ribosome rescue protein Dom34